MSESKLEKTLAFQLRTTDLPAPEREYRFHDTRGWLFDFAWPDHMLAVEVEGGTWQKGRHTTGKGFHDDCIKYNHAVLGGWRVLRFTADMVNDLTALTFIEMIFKWDNATVPLTGINDKQRNI